MSQPTPEPRRGLRAAWLAAALDRRRQVARSLFVGPAGVTDLDGGSASADDLAQWLQAHPASALHILLSGRLVHPLVVNEPGLASASRDDRLAWTRQQFLHFHGAEAAAWPLVVEAQPPILIAAALHGADLSAWQACASGHGSRLVSVQPWWTLAPRSVASAIPGWPGDGDAGLMLLEGEHASWLRFQTGRLVAIEQRRALAATGAAAAALLAEWQQEHRLGAAASTVAGFGLAGPCDDLGAAARVVGDLGARQPQPACPAP